MRLQNRFYAAIAALLAVAVCSGWLVSTALAANSPTGIHHDNNYDDAIAKADKKAKQVQNQIDNLSSALEDTDAALVSTNKKLLTLQAKLPALQAELNAATERYNAAKVQQRIVANKLRAAIAQDEDITAQIATDNDRIASLKITLGALAREQYMGEGTSDSLAIVFGSQSSSDFVEKFAAQHSAARVQTNAFNEIEEIAATNRNRGARQDAVRTYIADLNKQATALLKEADAAQQVASDKTQEVSDALDQLAVLKVTLAAHRKDSIAKQKKLEKEQDAVRHTILELVKKKLASENHGEKTPLGQGFLSFPTAVPYVTSPYGMRYHPILHYWRLHAGTDFRSYCGTPQYAAAPGKVVWAKYLPGLGNEVLLDHGFINGNSLMTSYNHESRFAVHAGQYVARGQLVGYSGSTGDSTACHLHFEVYVNGATVNPRPLLGL